MDHGCRWDGPRAARSSRHRRHGVDRSGQSAHGAYGGPQRVTAFASDNWATVHPAVLEAIARVNTGHVFAYGADLFTDEAVARVKAAFGNAAEPFFVLHGVSATVLAIGSRSRPYEMVICADTAHIVNDECGAVERLLGVRLTQVPSSSGKLTIDGMLSRVEGRGDEHRVQPRCVSITQTTEYGTLYTVAELRALVDAAHDADLVVHVDGARLANAAAALGVSLGAITADCGVD